MPEARSTVLSFRREAHWELRTLFFHGCATYTIDHRHTERFHGAEYEDGLRYFSCRKRADAKRAALDVFHALRGLLR
jgi:hypothetical protein